MHLGYKSPDEIQNFIKNAGCFVLPSVYEPWGVVVQEAALMALPMLCSNQIQAATSYLNDGDNGYLFDPLDENEICSAFKKIMALPDEDLSKMGCISQALGNKYTLVDWADRAAGFYYD
jgi:glycosyltransferase involved in cell wall biosynthesis